MARKKKPQRLHPPHRLRELRRASGATLADIAAPFGVTEATVKDWERDRVVAPWDVQVALARFYGVEHHFLMGDDEGRRIDVAG